MLDTSVMPAQAGIQAPEDRLSREARGIREEVREWLRARGIVVEDRARR